RLSAAASGEPDEVVTAASLARGRDALQPDLEAGTSQPAGECRVVRERPHAEHAMRAEGGSRFGQAPVSIQVFVALVRERIGSVVDVQQDGVVVSAGTPDAHADVL